MSTNNTRDKIIELGRTYMQTIGYHSFNYKQIALELNIKNASIHHYFPTKEDLGLAVIEKDKEDFTHMIKHLEALTAAEKAEALLNNYTQYFKSDKKLCVISTFGSAFNDVSEKIQLASSSYLNQIIVWLTAVFKEGLKSKEFRFKESADEMTAIWVAALPGSLIIGRMHGAAYFDQIISHLRKSLR